jgi:hypothetical protein
MSRARRPPKVARRGTSRAPRRRRPDAPFSRPRRFTKWFEDNTVLNEPEALPFSLSLPEVALDLTGLAGVVVAIYAGSYAYYLSARMAEAENKAAKQKARGAKDKAAKAKPPAKPAAAAPTLASAEEKPADPPAAA